jgi:flagellar basal body-associated protein FliL
LQDTYETEPNTQDEYYEPEPKKGMSGWLIVLIVLLVLIVACCLCAFLGLLLVGPAVGNTFSTIIQTIEVATPIP